MKHKRKALTLIEIVVVIGIALILYSFTTLNLNRSRNRISLDTTILNLTTEIKSQQLKSMSGVYEGGSVNPYYGIHFDSDGYTLFHSQVYQSGLSGNLKITLDTGDTFSQINLPSNELVFASTSGQINGFVPSQNSVTIQNALTSESKTLLFNRLGVITAVN